MTARWTSYTQQGSYNIHIQRRRNGELYRPSLCVTCIASCNHGARFAQFNISRWTLIFRFGFTETGNRSCRVVHWSNHRRHLIHASYLGISYFVPRVESRIDAGCERVIVRLKRTRSLLRENWEWKFFCEILIFFIANIFFILIDSRDTIELFFFFLGSKE